jgi:RNA polymerase sigma factor (sigma-70 family)
MIPDSQLLGDYVRAKSQDAFTQLVRRHLGLVYSAALRQVRSPQLAEEVSQSVFADLARAAVTLKADTILTAWLYQVTRRTAIDVVRRESRRQARERLAVEMAAMNTAADWTHIEPLLDDAMEALDETDRAAILLRYFENKSLREVGQSLGTSDDAAQKRVSRAVERLREFFSKRGIAIGASGLVVVVSANAVQAAPLALATTISTGALLTGSAFASTAITATKAIAMTTLQKIAITATVAILAGAGIYEARQASNVRELNKTLQQQQAPLIGQIERLTDEQNSLSNRLAGLRDDNERLKSNTTELLRLRGEVAMLRRQTKKSVEPEAAPQQEKPGARPFVSAEEFANAGLASPEATAKTLAWAMRSNDRETLAKILDPGQMQELLRQMMRKTDPNISDSDLSRGSNWFTSNLNFDNEKAADLQGYQILSQQFGSTNKAALEIVHYFAGGISETTPLKLHMVDGEWKMDLVAQAPETIPVTMSTTQDGITTNSIVNFRKEQEQTFVPVPENSTNP